MSFRQRIFLIVSLLALCAIGGFIVLGDNGLSELGRLREELAGMEGDNQELTRENMSLYRKVERLKEDYVYIEDVARNQLGVIGKDEVIIKIKEKPQP